MMHIASREFQNVTPRRHFRDNQFMHVVIRSARPEDIPFLSEMLHEAAAWREPGRVKKRELLRDPHIRRYIADWGRSGDTALIAFTQDGEGAGAAWYRIFSREEPGYGFVHEAVPELSIAVRHDLRGQGIGSGLLQALAQAGKEKGAPALSLSVEEDNPALRLYERIGFIPVNRVGNALTMRLDLTISGSASDRLYPDGFWPRRDPADLGVKSEQLSRAINELGARESGGPANMNAYLREILRSETNPKLLGAVKDAAGASGIIVHRGYVIAEWGDPLAVEMSFSVTKGYLSAVTGIALDRGLISDHHAPIAQSVGHEAFEGDRHSRIAWHHLLQQTSEWGGTLWGKPYWCDPQGKEGPDEPLSEPGSRWAYSDVRVNLLALALTLLFRRPLSNVLRDELMDRIGASNRWQWHGYENAFVTMDDRQVPVVSGGAHWGGGLWASAEDHARLGLLYLRRGQWRDEEVLSERWISASVAPGELNPDYGYLWWLNGRGRVFPAAPHTGYCARGNLGRQLIWIDPSLDLVIVSRWAEDVDAFLAAVSAAIPADA